MINDVVIVSRTQQSGSVIYIHISFLFQILSPFRLLHNTEQSSLCYTVGPCYPLRFIYLNCHMTIYYFIFKIYFNFIYFLTDLCCMWDLSSQTRIKPAPS